MDFEFERKTNLEKNVIFVDGAARCGKSLLGPILASLDKVEIERIEGIYDYVSLGYYYGKISKDLAISVLRTTTDEFLYNSFLSRNTNFRFSDHSSVFKSPQAVRYFSRLFSPEGKETLEKISKMQPFFQVQSHDQIRNFLFFCEVWPQHFKMIEIIRNPIELIDAWIRRGWGKRYGTDPLAFTPCGKFDRYIVPFYAKGWEKDYISMAPNDRVVRMLYELQRLNSELISEYSEKHSDKLFVTKFENLVTKPEAQIKLICDFLGTNQTSATPRAIKKQRCPRIISSKKTMQLDIALKKTISGESKKLVEWMVEDYHSMKF